MKEHHVELFVDLLVEKVDAMKAENDGLKQKIEQLRVDNYYKPEDGFAESHKAEYAEVIKSLDSATAKYVELKKQFEEINANHITLCKEREEIEFKYENAMQDVAVLKEQVAKLKKELANCKDTLNEGGRTGKLNVYERMVEYAKAKGFKFASNHDMKEFLERNTDKDGKPKKALNGVAVTEVDFSQHTKCPKGMANKEGHTMIVGSQDCKNCPFHKGVNYDESYVQCTYVK